MNALGTHLLLELRDCDPQLLDDLTYIREVMVNTAGEVGATIVGEAFHKFSPYGVTGVVAISESHEQAVINAGDRRVFRRMLTDSLERQGLSAATSEKDRSKRTPWL